MQAESPTFEILGDCEPSDAAIQALARLLLAAGEDDDQDRDDESNEPAPTTQ